MLNIDLRFFGRYVDRDTLFRGCRVALVRVALDCYSIVDQRGMTLVVAIGVVGVIACALSAEMQ